MTDRERSIRGALEVLAAVAPDRRLPRFDVSGDRSSAMAWLGAAFGLAGTDVRGDRGGGAPAALDRLLPAIADVSGLEDLRTTATIESLRRHDALTPGSHDLRVGWLWVVGTAPFAGRDRRFCLPLVSRTASLDPPVLRLSRRTLVRADGPWDLWPLLDDGAGLEQRIAWGGGAIDDDTPVELISRLVDLRQWVDDVVAAAGLPPARTILPPSQDPTQLRPAPVDGLVAIAGFGLYADDPVDPTRPRDTLTAWSSTPDVGETAFGSIYAPRPDPPTAGAPPAPTDRPPLPLTVAQGEALQRSRTAAVTVVSGPPGTGKSHTAAAVALDAVARGESVLVATRSITAAEVIAGLLDRMGGPTPVLFGGGHLTSVLARKLADGLTAPPDHSAEEALAASTARLSGLQTAVGHELAAVRDAATWHEQLLTLSSWSLVAGRLFDAGDAVDPSEAAALLDRARTTTGLFAGWRRNRAAARLRELVGASEDTDLDRIAAALELAALRERAGRAQTGTDAVHRRRWQALCEAIDHHQRAWTAALAAAVARRPGADERRAVAALATALRAGRAGRRAHLLGIDVPTLTRALPLWVGTLDQVESLLPPVAGEFDLVVLDEASQIDQVAGSAALLRARRAVVVGDPRQLRFVSFVADDDITAAVQEVEQRSVNAGARVELPSDRLDVRRVSAFDLAASAAPVTFLDEHFRSIPHLIGFSAQRFYDGRLHVATRHPVNETTIGIDLRRVPGDRTDGVNRAEVEAALAAVRELAAVQPNATVGVISPYRAQVDAIEAALGEPEHAELVASGRVKVGTVHGFQGAECDAMVASFGVEGSGDRGRAFLEDPNLFNVLVTRARSRMVALATPDDPPPGVFADYLHWAGTPPDPVPDGAPGGAPAAVRWTEALAAVLRDAGVTTRIGYPVGRWIVDLVVGDGPDAVAVTTSVHPDGIAVHVDRHLSLHRAGWRQAEAFAVDTDPDPVATALALRALAGDVTTPR